MGRADGCGHGGTGVGQRAWSWRAKAGPTQRRPGTHPIQAAQVLHPVLIPILVIVDDRVLLVHAARLGDTDSFQEPFLARQGPGSRGTPCRRPHCLPAITPPTQRPPPQYLHTSSTGARPGYWSTLQGCAEMRAGSPNPSAATLVPSLCDQPSIANRQEPPPSWKLPLGQPWEGLGTLWLSGT